MVEFIFKFLPSSIISKPIPVYMYNTLIKNEKRH